jgi:hypothetical protein
VEIFDLREKSGNEPHGGGGAQGAKAPALFSLRFRRRISAL